MQCILLCLSLMNIVFIIYQYDEAIEGKYKIYKTLFPFWMTRFLHYFFVCIYQNLTITEQFFAPEELFFQ